MTYLASVGEVQSYTPNIEYDGIRKASLALFPGSPALECEMHAWRVWYLFSRENDVIKKGPEFLEQQGNVLHTVQPTIHGSPDL